MAKDEEKQENFVPQDVKKKYLAEVSRLIERAYEEKTIETKITDKNIALTINIPRKSGQMLRETVDLLTKIHTVQP